jgi:hypothetical protein
MMEIPRGIISIDPQLLATDVDSEGQHHRSRSWRGKGRCSHRVFLVPISIAFYIDTDTDTTPPISIAFYTDTDTDTTPPISIAFYTDTDTDTTAPISIDAPECRYRLSTLGQ